METLEIKTNIAEKKVRCDAPRCNWYGGMKSMIGEHNYITCNRMRRVVSNRLAEACTNYSYKLEEEENVA